MLFNCIYFLILKINIFHNAVSGTVIKKAKSRQTFCLSTLNYKNL
jgi:hypothetical protein